MTQPRHDPPLGTRLAELAGLFLKLGIIGFGGPAAHIAMMEDECVVRRRWLSREQFMDLVGATNLIPGPNSTEMTMHIGQLRAGALGLIVAGTCFIVPAVLIVGVFAWAYANYGTLPEVGRLMYGIKPAVLALILVAIWRLGRTAVKNHRLLVLAIIVALASYFNWVNEIVALIGGALIGMAWLRLGQAREAAEGRRRGDDGGGQGPPSAAPLIALSLWWWERCTSRVRLLAQHSLIAGPPPEVMAQLAARPPWWDIGLVFLQIGSVIYGGGYVLIALLQSAMVEQRGWLTQTQLLDAVAIGQITPGPLFTTATFVGYIITATPGDVASGVPGALAATVGIFLPSFIFVAILGRLIPHLRKWTWTAAFMDAVNAAAVALMAAVLVKLAQQVLVDQGQPSWPAIAIATAAAMILLRFKVASAWIVVGGAMVGWFVFPWA